MKPEVESTLQDQVQFGSKTITYSVERSKRTSLGISVNPDASVSVVAPYDASLMLIREKVLKRADWIIKQQLDFVEMEKPVARYNYTSGESHWYLGKQYRLKFNRVRQKCLFPCESLRRNQQSLVIRTSQSSTDRLVKPP